MSGSQPADFDTITSVPNLETHPNEGEEISDHRVNLPYRRYVMSSVAGLLLGTALIFLSYRNARSSTSNTHFLIFWIGFSMVLLPTLLAGWHVATPRKFRSVLLLGYGVATFVPKFLMSVNGPNYFDEYGHFRHVNDVLTSGNLLAPNTYIPVIRYYPGLSMATIAIHEVTRLSLWHSGQLVILASHCASLFIVMAIGRLLGLKPSYAFLAALVFSLNPSFLYFDTEYAYESLGLTFALATVLACMKTRLAPTVSIARCWTAVGSIFALSCTVTHHLSSLYMTVFTSAIALIIPTLPEANAEVVRRAQLGAWLVAGSASIGVLGWIGLVATPTISYLSPHIGPAFSQFLNIVLRRQSKTYVVVRGVRTGVTTGSRSLFSGSLVPNYEKLSGYISPFVVLISTAIGALNLSAGRHAGIRFRLWIIFAVLGVGYFLSLPLALTASGSEGAHRSWEFTYIGVALVSAAGVSLSMPWVRRRCARVRRTIVVLSLVAISIVAIGNVGSGENVYYRFPGPYQFGTDTRSVTPELIHLAAWARVHTVPHANVVTDRFTGEVIEGYTTLNVPTPAQFGAYLLYQDGSTPSAALLAALRAGQFRYFILDRRIETEYPVSSFFEGYHGASSVSIRALRNMDSTPFARIIYRSLNYEIFKLDPGSS